jgi:hypothetical protein
MFKKSLFASIALLTLFFVQGQVLAGNEVSKIESLKLQYPIEWFYKKYCKQSTEDDGLFCSITKQEADQLSLSQLKSIFLHYNFYLMETKIENRSSGNYRDGVFLKMIMSDKLSFNSKPKVNKFLELKKLIYSQDFLKHNYIGCPIINELPTTFPNYRDIILQQIFMQNESLHIIYIECLNDKNLKKDREIAIESIKNTGIDTFQGRRDDLIKEVLENFVDDKEIAELAISYGYYNVEYISNGLKSDKNFIISILKKDYFNPKNKILDYLPELKNNKDVMMEILMDGIFWALNDSNLQDDKDFIIKLINDLKPNQISLLLNQNLSQRLQKDKEVQSLILKKSIRAN